MTAAEGEECSHSLRKCDSSPGIFPRRSICHSSWNSRLAWAAMFCCKGLKFISSLLFILGTVPYDHNKSKTVLGYFKVLCVYQFQTGSRSKGKVEIKEKLKERWVLGVQLSVLASGFFNWIKKLENFFYSQSTVSLYSDPPKLKLF